MPPPSWQATEVPGNMETNPIMVCQWAASGQHPAAHDEDNDEDGEDSRSNGNNDVSNNRRDLYEKSQKQRQHQPPVAARSTSPAQAATKVQPTHPCSTWPKIVAQQPWFLHTS